MKLLELTAPKYLRRLAKELNHSRRSGFHSHGDKWTKARVTKAGVLQVRLNELEWMPTDQSWRFTDTSGIQITASRKA